MNWHKNDISGSCLVGNMSQTWSVEAGSVTSPFEWHAVLAF